MLSVLPTSNIPFDASAFFCQAINTRITRNDSSQNTTRSGTPEDTRKDCFDERTSPKQECLIDVKPKQRKFKTSEEREAFVNQYKMKIKTELCKNFELKGWCKFGDSCSFAHGKHELQEKKHLHQKYKTRPCKEFHLTGYCSYGIRCQYLHKDAFGVNIFYEPSTAYPSNAERNNYSYELLDEIWRMSNSHIKPERIFEKLPAGKKRLPVFAAFSN